jgi:hypothetical protein
MKPLALARLTAAGILSCLALPVWPQQKRDDLTKLDLEHSFPYG